MVEGDASKMWRGPLLYRQRETSPREATGGNSSKGLLNRPKDTNFGQPRHARCTAAGASSWGFFDAFTPN
jgi:hypothetical protein